MAKGNKYSNQQTGQSASTNEDTNVTTPTPENDQSPAEETSTESQAPAVTDQGVQDAAQEPKSLLGTVVAEAKKAAEKVEEVIQEVVSAFEAKVAAIRAEGTVAGKALVHAFDLYFEAVLPGKPVDPDAGARAQFAFWRALYTVIHSAPQEEFKPLWNLVLAYFNNHAEDIFHSRYVFRFSESWSGSAVELAAFQRLLNLIHLTANPQTRAAGLKQVDLGRSLADFFTEEDRQRLITFYR